MTNRTHRTYAAAPQHVVGMAEIRVSGFPARALPGANSDTSVCAPQIPKQRPDRCILPVILDVLGAYHLSFPA